MRLLSFKNLYLWMLYGVNSYPCRGASLCSGNLHPDVVIHQERYIKTSKKLYFSELQKYHNGYEMLRVLHFVSSLLLDGHK